MSEIDTSLLRKLPRVDAVLHSGEMQKIALPEPVKTEIVRAELAELRAGILNGTRTELPAVEVICGMAAARAQAELQPNLRKVINGTGIPLHTNLGRACLSEQAAEAARVAAASYSNLEYDLASGARGSRYSHVEQLLCTLTGAEAAMVVNNNAAAVLLILSAMAAGGEVVISRGELVEIGGSFRIPEIMEQCGCTLREVGATNKTHLSDYEKAIGEHTRALLKVHTSNYRVVGFTESVPASELTELGRAHGLPVIEDLGSGCLIDLSAIGLTREPTVGDSVRAGIDVISFSGDKLLGGPQAGIIIGRKKYMDMLKKHPLTRAMRVDKMTLAALEVTLRSYRNPKDALEEIPVLRMLSVPLETLRNMAEALCRGLTDRGVSAEVLPEVSQVGGGSLPGETLPTFAVAVSPEQRTVDELECLLRGKPTPIIGRISHDRYLLDVRTLQEDDFSYIAASIAEELV